MHCGVEVAGRCPAARQQAWATHYDGILGVLCGLEVVRTLNDRGLQTKRGITIPLIKSMMAES